MKVIILNGSPKAKGNTARALREVEQTLNRQGIETEWIHVGHMDIRRLPYLSDKDVKRLKKYLKAYKKLIGEPVYSIYAARQEHPNAYGPWTEEADAELRMMWDKGVSVNEIADHFGRKSSAIITRMKKLGL